jgi:hypothetical protein
MGLIAFLYPSSSSESSQSYVGSSTGREGRCLVGVSKYSNPSSEGGGNRGYILGTGCFEGGASLAATGAAVGAATGISTCCGATGSVSSAGFPLKASPNFSLSRLSASVSQRKNPHLSPSGF